MSKIILEPVNNALNIKAARNGKLKPISCTYSLELVHLYFLTIAKEGTEKAINIMVITDHFTRYAQTYITQRQMVPVVAKTLWDQFWNIMGGQLKF